MKSPFASKTIWTNLLSIIAMLAQSHFGFVIDPQDQVMLLGVINLVLRAVTKEPLNWSQAKNQAGRSRSGVICLLLVIALTTLMVLPVLPGCSPMAKRVASDDLTAQLVVRAATGRVLDKHPEWVKETYRITGEVLHLVQQDQPVSLADLEQAVVKRVNWKQLNLEEQDLLRALITAVRLDLERYLADRGVSDPGQSVIAVMKVIDWINQAALTRMSLTSRAEWPAVPVLAYA